MTDVIHRVAVAVMAAITGVFSALIFYGFLTFIYYKQFSFNIQYEGDWSTDAFDVFITRIQRTGRSEFCLEICPNSHKELCLQNGDHPRSLGGQVFGPQENISCC